MPREDEGYGARAVAQREDRDLLLAQRFYAYIMDKTKGSINTFVGPLMKTITSQQEQPVRFNASTGKFDSCNVDEAITAYTKADEGSYIVLSNPVVSGTENDKHPARGTNNNVPDTAIGRKINIPGPKDFPLWPGQSAVVIPGHRLRSNQYLVIRVYNEEEAKKNWGKAVVKLQTTSSADGETNAKPVSEASEEGKKGSDKQQSSAEASVVKTDTAPALTMGQLLVIKGTDVSFYIPPTGIEVVQDEGGDYVRSAVTLERLEYSILLDENGDKRFVKGPKVVFPEPTEEFVEQDGQRKFEAIELNHNMALHVKVIADYNEGGKDYKAGEELFIRGTELAIYYPRAEHAMMKYGRRSDRHYATALPEGEGRYVLDTKAGVVDNVMGPTMLLPDPRSEVIVRRVLSDDQVELWYPKNDEALQHNRKLRQALPEGKEDSEYVAEDVARESLAFATLGASRGASKSAFVGDEFRRGTTYTPPRTITLNTKYDGVVTVEVWPGFAVMVTNKNGDRRVVEGPATLMLEYNESLLPMSLDTGTPKKDDKLLRTVFLQVRNNKVTDRVEVAETKDLCKVSIKLSYRVNFEGEASKWFDVDNYVKFLTRHLRSFVCNVVKRHTIGEFYGKAIDILRDAILGTASEATEQNPHPKRPGRSFEENGMRVYDVEVLEVTISDPRIADLLTAEQRLTMERTLQVARKEQELQFTMREQETVRAIDVEATKTAQAKEDLNRQKLQDAAKTAELQAKLDGEKIAREQQLEEKKLAAQQQAQELGLAVEQAKQAIKDAVNTAELARTKAESDQELAVAEAKLQLELQRVKAQVEAVVEKMKAITPDLIAAMEAMGDKDLAGKLSENFNVLSMLGQENVREVFEKAFGNMPQLVQVVNSIYDRSGNGGVSRLVEPAGTRG